MAGAPARSHGVSVGPCSFGEAVTEAGAHQVPVPVAVLTRRKRNSEAQSEAQAALTCCRPWSPLYSGDVAIAASVVAIIASRGRHCS
eukprot:3933641-Rhodomonas_salina.4